MRKKTIAAILAIVSVGLVSAALVSYLSNTIFAQVNVSSPIEIVFDDGLETKSFDVFGGDSIEYTTIATNKANRSIDVYNVVQVIESPMAWSGTEFQSITLIDRGVNKGNVLPYLCHIKPDGSVIPFSAIGAEATTTAKLIMDDDCNPEKYSHPSGSSIDNQVTVILNPSIMPGQYDMKLCHLYSLTGECA